MRDTRPPSRFLRLALAAVVLAISLGAVAGTGLPELAAQEKPQATVTDNQAKALVAALDTTLKSGTGTERAAAVTTTALNDHRLVADRLVALALDEQAAADIHAAAFEGLRLQKASAASVTTRVLRWIGKQAEADSGALKRGDLGVPVDKRSGDAIAKGAAYDAAVKASGARAAWITPALRLVAASPAPKDGAELLRPFLQSPHDDLAVAALQTLGAWKAKEALPDIQFLFRMYPRENRWETSAVAHIGGTNASAKAEWMRYFGHPLKQRHRADVHLAIRAAIEAITGHKVTTPEDLDAQLAASRGDRRKSR